jgi:hypothetical protein
LLGTIVLSALGCHAKVDEFFERTFPCDIQAPTNTCGVDREGNEMICVSEPQLGGQAFCAETCDPALSAESSDGTVCLNTGARVVGCAPTRGKVDKTVACPAGLRCYRTDVIFDEGICLPVPVCATDSDCVNPTRPRCAGQVLRDLYPGLPIATDGLQCLADHCDAARGGCPTGESCLAAVLPLIPGTPDVCLPNCDGNLHCPPNFVCGRVASGPGTPPICIPGLPGYRCTSDLDCLLGFCVDTGAGFNVCAMPCHSDENCVIYNRTADGFVCVPDIAGTGKHCVTLSPFAGAVCQTSADCPADEQCFQYTPYESTLTGECRVPCGADGSCPSRGGVPHVCLLDGEGGCFPGAFGLPCAGPNQCYADLSCVDVTPTGAGPSSVRSATKICTIACMTDSDCDADPWVLHQGYCDDGFCRLGGGAGDPCQREQECRTRICRFSDGESTGTCLDPASP